ncbi:MAG: type II secretion system F family protein, partial [Anaerohalosphaera sp.]|nr:type II secretion system F family protein [Anaerohalosphaera sp.]
LTTIATFMEKKQKVESKMITALIYPIILICACVAAVLILTIVVLPKIIEQIQLAGQELPWITKALMSFSETMRSWKIFIIIGAIALIVTVVKKILKTPRGTLWKDSFMLNMPVFGPLVKQRIVARFASTLSTLLGAGLSMADSLRIVAEVTGNVVMNNAVKKSRERIISGADIATPLRDSGVINPTIAHMVTVGEKSGELEKMLLAISEDLESSSDVVVDRLSAAIEPIIIVFMVGVIGVIAFATLLPILNFSSGLH